MFSVYYRTFAWIALNSVTQNLSRSHASMEVTSCGPLQLDPSSSETAASVPLPFPRFRKHLKTMLFVSDSSDLGRERLRIPEWSYINAQLKCSHPLVYLDFTDTLVCTYVELRRPGLSLSMR